jgi:cytochrome c oxidase subunit 2
MSFLLQGCSGPQSALDPASPEAQRIATLTWWLFAGAGMIWLAVVVLAILCGKANPESFTSRKANFIIVGGGVIFPTVVLTALLGYGLAMLPSLLKPAPPASLTIEVEGELWWWRVKYLLSERESASLANEIHLPVGEPVEFHLKSDNVIHSFWIPSLGGKVDMLPGRTTRLALTPTKAGVFRGVCAEYCGDSHALMKFDVVVENREDFENWLAQQSEPGVVPNDPVAVFGQEAFLSNGCGACHTIRGTDALGEVGPDLTHVGSRLHIAAGALPNQTDHLYYWIMASHATKPGSRMPKFNMLPEDELRAMAVYLKGLR